MFICYVHSIYIDNEYQGKYDWGSRTSERSNIVLEEVDHVEAHFKINMYVASILTIEVKVTGISELVTGPELNVTVVPELVTGRI